MQKDKYVLMGGTVFAALVVLLVFIYMENPGAYQTNVANVSEIAIQNNPAKPPFPDIKLPNSVQGEAAILALGTKLPEVALYYKLSEDELKKIIRTDNTIHLDKNGRLLYVDTETVSSSNIPSSVAGSSLNSDGLLPLDQTFVLHSRPNATKTIYLDFNGHVLEYGKSSWTYYGGQTIIAPPFDIDGNPSVFGDAERQIIQEIWMRVAEDYSMYDVNVTTQEPPVDRIERTSNSDIYYGNRILFSNIAAEVGHASAGGTSYIGVFDDTSEMSKTSLCYPANLANGAKYMGDCASHENGHALGLTHDGVTGVTAYYSGHGNWAPIMGVTYYTQIGQWSKGEYANANNTQDDLQVITTFGLSYVPDDAGNSISGAANMNVSGNTASVAGFTERTGDVDFYKFNTGAGDISINVAVSPIGPNMDVEATLYDSAGRVITTQDPYGLPASLSATVQGGTYYVSVKGVGAGDPRTDGYSNYDSLGQYYITGTIVGTNDNPPVAVASAVPSSGPTPLSVQFSSSGSYDPDGGALTYSWNFGDGTNSTEPNPAKVYNDLGTYSVTLTVKDQSNLSGTKSVQISAMNQPPVANFTTSASSNNIPATVSFDASSSSDSDGIIISYDWDFGDGAVDTGQMTSHTYTTAGTYLAKLTVTDNSGLTGSKTVSITTADPNALNAPTNLSVSGGGKVKGIINLKWTDNSNNETGFYIERALSSRTGTPIYQRVATVGANVTAYTETLPAGTYIYRVQSYNSSLSKVSDYSNAAQIKIR